VLAARNGARDGDEASLSVGANVADAAYRENGNLIAISGAQARMSRPYTEALEECLCCCKHTESS
jgi:hypothetical protein